MGGADGCHCMLAFVTEMKTVYSACSWKIYSQTNQGIFTFFPNPVKDGHQIQKYYIISVNLELCFHSESSFQQLSSCNGAVRLLIIIHILAKGSPLLP